MNGKNYSIKWILTEKKSITNLRRISVIKTLLNLWYLNVAPSYLHNNDYPFIYATLALFVVLILHDKIP